MKVISPIGWFGGKGNIHQKIIKYFPNKFSCYAELFGGSGVVMLNTNCSIKYFNDIDKTVYSLFKTIQDKGRMEALMLRLSLTPYHDDFRKESKEALKGSDMSEDDIAYHMLVVNRMSVNSLGGFSVCDIVRKGLPKSVNSYLSAIDSLPQICEILKEATIFNEDAFKLMDRLDKPNTFMYLDPPYHLDTRGKTRYKHDFSVETQKLFVDKCLSMKSKVLVSGYDNEDYNRLTDAGWKKVSFDVKLTTDNRMTLKTECLWMNYEIEEQLSLV